MTLLLAPMEGVLDHSLRDVLSRVGGFDRCVSEFIRITDRLLPPRVFIRLMPELLTGSCTAAGVPVRAQLLGSDPACLADNAARLAELGAEGIDLNFGCPAKIVNRHRGGAVLLDEPELVGRIVAAVRAAVPAQLPVSAKMRLGNRDDDPMLDVARAIDQAGANELVVHARTKTQGYRPPAFWDRIAVIRAAVALPVVANGEIWTLDDALRARAESGGAALMLGRGAVADPGLAWAIRGHDAQALGATPQRGPLDWAELLPLLALYWASVARHTPPKHRAGRLKQWLFLLRRRHAQAQTAFDLIRRLNDPSAVARCLFGPSVAAPAALETAAVRPACVAAPAC